MKTISAVHVKTTLITKKFWCIFIFSDDKFFSIEEMIVYKTSRKYSSLIVNHLNYFHGLTVVKETVTVFTSGSPSHLSDPL